MRGTGKCGIMADVSFKSQDLKLRLPVVYTVHVEYTEHPDKCEYKQVNLNLIVCAWVSLFFKVGTFWLINIC